MPCSGTDRPGGSACKAPISNVSAVSCRRGRERDL